MKQFLTVASGLGGILFVVDSCYVDVPKDCGCLLYNRWDNTYDKKVLGEGAHIINPIYQATQLVSFKDRNIRVSTSSQSKDKVAVDMTFRGKYHVMKEEAVDLYTKYGENFGEYIIPQMVRETMVEASNYHEAKELKQKQGFLKDAIALEIKKRSRKLHIRFEKYELTKLAVYDGEVTGSTQMTDGRHENKYVDLKSV